MSTELLETSKQILRDFQSEFAKTGQSNEKDDAYVWLYGARRYYPLMQRMRENRSLPSFYTQSANLPFEKWLQLSLEVQNIDSYRIPAPFNDETLHAYLLRLRSTLIDQQERRTIWWQSLRSFTHFLREEAKLIELYGELDVIFPEEMTIYFDNLFRKTPVTLYPIDIWAAADIIQNLTKFALEGRSNSQESAAQALGLAWICLACGHAQCMTRLEILYDLPLTSLKEIEPNDLFKPNHWLTARTLFGKVDVPISKTIYNYLQSLPRTNPHYIFSQPLRTLRRALDRAIAASTLTQYLGKITFFTLMHRSHEARGHRFKGYGDRLKDTP